METRTKTLIAVATALLIGGGAIASMASAEGWKQAHYERGHHGEHGKGRHHGQRFERLLQAYDSNGDGKLTQAEIDGVRAERLAKFDANGDGQLNLQEYEALWLDAMRERMVDRFQRHDDDGDGQVTAEEFGERFSRMVARRDRNGDGELSREDFRRMRDRDDDDE